MGKPRKLPYQIITPVETILAGQPYELLSEVRAVKSIMRLHTESWSAIWRTTNAVF